MRGGARQHSVSCAFSESTHCKQGSSRGKQCFSVGKRWGSLKPLLSNALRRVSTLPYNAKRFRTVGRMGEVGPPAALASLFTEPCSHLGCSTVIPPCGAKWLPPLRCRAMRERCITERVAALMRGRWLCSRTDHPAVSGQD